MIHTIQKGKEYKSRLPLSDSISHKKRTGSIFFQIFQEFGIHREKQIGI